MKTIKIAAGVVGALLVLFLGAVMMQPAHAHIERSKVMNAAPSDVYPMVADLSTWPKWSPWADIDPNQKTAYSANPTGKGAWSTWEGNDDVGKGKMTLTDVVENQKVVEKLEFFEPFAAVATVTFTLTPEGDGTKVLWAYDAENAFMARAAGMFMNMDQMLGADFERGLNRLAPLVEATAVARREAEAAAAAAAAEAAAAAAATQMATDAGGTPVPVVPAP